MVKRFGITVLILPVTLFVIWGLYEVFGMCINQIATKEQTNTLQMNLENDISDIEIFDIEIEDCMWKYYVSDEWSCYVNKTDDEYYTI